MIDGSVFYVFFLYIVTMMNTLIRYRIVFTVLLLGGLATVHAEDIVGIITFIEGEVSLTRDGELLNSHNLFPGFSIRMFDTLETGRKSHVEVAMSTPSAGSTLKVMPKTVFYFETTPSKSSWLRTTFQLLRGALRFKVANLLSKESYNVQTDNALMAVRGTEFTIDLSPDRSTLLTVVEGRVELKSRIKNSQVIPGIVATVDERSALTTSKVHPSEIEKYRQYWQNSRIEALKINADLSIEQYARMWEREFPRFERAVQELSRYDSIFQRWSEIEAGRIPTPSNSAAIQDKIALSRGMINFRSALPLVERAYHTLVGLEEFYNAGYAQKTFRGTGRYVDARDFYRSFQKDKIRIREMLSKSRKMIRIYRLIESSVGFSSGSGLLDTIPTL